MTNHPNRGTEAKRASEIWQGLPSREVPNMSGWRYVAVWSESGRTGSAAHRGAYVLADHWDIGDDGGRRFAQRRLHPRYLIVRYDSGERLVGHSFSSDWPEWAGYPRLAALVGEATVAREPENLNADLDQTVKNFMNRLCDDARHPNFRTESEP